VRLFRGTIWNYLKEGDLEEKRRVVILMLHGLSIHVHVDKSHKDNTTTPPNNRCRGQTGGEREQFETVGNKRKKQKPEFKTHFKTVFCSDLLSGKIDMQGIIHHAQTITEGALTLIDIGLCFACEITRNKTSKQTSCTIREAPTETLLEVRHFAMWWKLRNTNCQLFFYQFKNGQLLPNSPVPMFFPFDVHVE
jgi:hypothetical protein